MKTSTAIHAIERAGVLLVFPVKGRDDPPSLWSALHPRAKMRWAWDEGADDRVVELWHLRAALARSRRVVYGKWLLGRATFFSRDLFRALLATLREGGDLEAGLSHDSRRVLDALEENSPQPTRALREATELQGRFLEAAFMRAMKPLWTRGLVVGAGEVEEGGFPSLAVGATKLLFEEIFVGSTEPRDLDRDAIKRACERSAAFAGALRRARASMKRPSSK